MPPWTRLRSERWSTAPDAAARSVSSSATAPPGRLELYETLIRVNLVGTFNVLRLAATRMARNEPVDGERGVCVLTASVAAWEGQVARSPTRRPRPEWSG